MIGPTWLAVALERSLVGVAETLGFELAAGPSLRPCPACAEQHRQRGDRRRGPVSLFVGRDGRERWSCKRASCGEGGDLVDLVSYAVVGKHYGGASISERELVRAWLDDRRAVCREPRKRHLPTRQRPPVSEIEAVWAASDPIDRTLVSPPIAEMWPTFFLADRRFIPSELAALDIARITPLRYEWPSWWPRSWASTFRLVVRAFEPNGTVASLHARAVPSYDNDGVLVRKPARKSTWPFGCNAAGLIFADAAGLRLMRERVIPRNGVLVTEGVTDLMRAAITARDLDHSIAVLGAAAGGFAGLAKIDWPRGAHVFICTDMDETGERYFQTAESALRSRGVAVYRLDPRTLEGAHEQ